MRLSLLLLALLAAAPAVAQPLAINSPTPEAEAEFGNNVAGIPDADGDGRGDFLVGAGEEYVGSFARAGRAYAFSGATGTLLYTFEPAYAELNGRFGEAVSGVEDVDGDGRGDFLIGAPGEERFLDPDESGLVYVYSGATGVLLYTLESPASQYNGSFGKSVSGVPDADGDGRGDLLVGAIGEDADPYDDQHQVYGRAYLFSGASGRLLHGFESANSEYRGFFGYSVSGVPDADGDGRGDVLIGAQEEDGGAEDAGRAYLFSGVTGALLYAFESPNARPLGNFGGSVAGVSDADGDGRGDLLVGATYTERYVYVFSGRTGALLYELSSPDENGYLTGYVTGVPDVDGDGRGDLGVGAYGENARGVESSGRAYVFSGRTGERLFTLSSPNAEVDGFFGLSVAGMEDADGDGLGDGVVGSREAAGGLEDAGRVYRYRTGEADGAWGGAEEVTAAGEPEAESPATLALAAAPNPLTSETALRVALPRPAEATVEVLDVLGRRVALVHEGALAAGTHDLRWAPAAGVPGGVYLLRLRVAGEPTRTQRVTLAR